MNVGSIPVLSVSGKSLPEAWEQSLIKLWDAQGRVRTQYDRRDEHGEFIDPPSIDCTMLVVVEDPDSDPRFHRCFPGGPADLQEYRMEVLGGIKDHWVDLKDKAKWQYTYHERLRKYDIVSSLSGGTGFRTDQIQKMIEQLAKDFYTRRAQAITWQPWKDQDSADPPCLQRVWCRIIENHGELYLNMDVNFRSRDAYKAAFMNMDALIELQKVIAAGVSGRLGGRPVMLGRYMDVSDSYHIYGKDIAMFVREFLPPLSNRSFYDDVEPLLSRTASAADWAEMMAEAVPEILEKVRRKDAGE